VAGWKDHRLGLLPTSATSLIRSPFVGWRSKAQLGRLLVTFPRLESGTLAEMSAAAWVRSLGLRDDAASVLSTLIRVATYAPDLEAIAADAAVRQLQLVQTGGVSYLHGGWTELVKGLVEATTKSGGRMATEERAVNVAQAHTGDPSASWEVRTSARTWVSRAVIIATGSPAAARSLLPFDPDWSLGADATAACLDLGLRHPPANLAVFGIDQPLYLSTHAPSAKLAPKGAALVHVMRYGARSSESDRAELWEFAQGAGIRKEDVVVERFLHRMVVTHSLPVPGIGLTGRPPVAVGGHPGLFIAGDWVGPIGLLADAAIASGQAAGQAAAAVSNGPSLPIVDERRAG
jgi:phytoene dehydrogenase-like protein